MDRETAAVLWQLGINPDTVPAGTVKLLRAEQYRDLSDEAKTWAYNPNNNQALAYEVETEHERHKGLILRNLHPKKPEAAHLLLIPKEGTLWHNWTPAVLTIWQRGVAVLVEGPKDARVLHSFGIWNTLAYLGAVPSKRHLTVLKRYCHSILWIPDVEPLDPNVARRRDAVETSAREMGLSIRRMTITAKDPALLVNQPDEIKRINETVQEMVLLGRGGYQGVGKQK